MIKIHDHRVEKIGILRPDPYNLNQILTDTCVIGKEKQISGLVISFGKKQK